MAFPYIFAENFERGTLGTFDSETDTDGILDFPSYSELARFPWSQATPYTGAYCLRIAPSGGTSDATLTEADINIADTATSHFSFDLYFGSDFTATADDTFALLELQGAASAVVVALGITVTAATGAAVLAAGSAVTAATPSTDGTLELIRNTWYTVEMSANIETNASGTIDVYVTKAGDAAQTVAEIALSSQDHIAVTDGVFGLQNQLATTTGTILLDNFVQDDARVYPRERFNRAPVFTQSGHAFIGPGSINGAALLTDEATNVARLWDTDVADTNSTQNFMVELDTDNRTSFSGPLFFKRGCYVELAGTDPRAQVFLQGSHDRVGTVGPLYHTPAGVRRWGLSK